MRMSNYGFWVDAATGSHGKRSYSKAVATRQPGSGRAGRQNAVRDRGTDPITRGDLPGGKCRSHGVTRLAGKAQSRSRFMGSSAAQLALSRAQSRQHERQVLRTDIEVLAHASPQHRCGYVPVSSFLLRLMQNVQDHALFPSQTVSYIRNFVKTLSHNRKEMSRHHPLQFPGHTITISGCSLEIA